MTEAREDLATETSILGAGLKFLWVNLARMFVFCDSLDAVSCCNAGDEELETWGLREGELGSTSAGELRGRCGRLADEGGSRGVLRVAEEGE